MKYFQINSRVNGKPDVVANMGSPSSLEGWAHTSA